MAKNLLLYLSVVAAAAAAVERFYTNFMLHANFQQTRPALSIRCSPKSSSSASSSSLALSLPLFPHPSRSRLANHHRLIRTLSNLSRAQPSPTSTFSSPLLQNGKSTLSSVWWHLLLPLNSDHQFPECFKLTVRASSSLRIAAAAAAANLLTLAGYTAEFFSSLIVCKEYTHTQRATL